MTSAQQVAYHAGTERKSYNSRFIGNATAAAVTSGVCVTAQTDNSVGTTTAGRTLTVAGTHIEYTCDHMGRLATGKAAVNGSTTLRRHHLYRGCRQIAYCELLRSNYPGLWLITRPPTQPIDTRPSATQEDVTWYTYSPPMEQRAQQYCTERSAEQQIMVKSSEDISNQHIRQECI